MLWTIRRKTDQEQQGVLSIARLGSAQCVSPWHECCWYMWRCVVELILDLCYCIFLAQVEPANLWSTNKNWWFSWNIFRPTLRPTTEKRNGEWRKHCCPVRVWIICSQMVRQFRLISITMVPCGKGNDATIASQHVDLKLLVQKFHCSYLNVWNFCFVMFCRHGDFARNHFRWL